MQKIQNGKWMELDLMDQRYLEAIKKQSTWIGRILDTNYEKADLEQEITRLIHLTKLEWVILLSCLKQYEDLFDGNIGEWTVPPVDTPLKDYAKPYHARALPILVIHLEYLKIFE